MAFLDSTKVKVFPSAYRGKITVDGVDKVYDPESRLNSEKNLTGLVSRLTNSSFVINREFDFYPNTPLYINIIGYWFELDLEEALGEGGFAHDWSNIYATIKTKVKNPSYEEDTTNTQYEAKCLVSTNDENKNVLDYNGKFEGIELTNTKPADASKTLYILKGEDSLTGWVIPVESRLIFDSSSVGNKDKEDENYLPLIDYINSHRLECNYIKCDDFDDEGGGGNIETINLGWSDSATGKNLGLTFNNNANNFTIKNGTTEIEKTTNSSKSVNIPLYIKGPSSSTSSTQLFTIRNKNGYLLEETTPSFKYFDIPLISDSSLYINDPENNDFYKEEKGVSDNNTEIIRSIYKFSSTQDNIGINVVDVSDQEWNLYTGYGSNADYFIEYEDNTNILNHVLKIDSSYIYPYESIIPSISGLSLGSTAHPWVHGYIQNIHSDWVYAQEGVSTSVISGSIITASDYFDVSSDIRLKENIKSFEPHKSILDLPIVEFDFKESKTHHIGCIAQDLQEICPEIVHENEDGYLSIEESKIVYLLIDEVRKLKEEIKSLKGE